MSLSSHEKKALAKALNDVVREVITNINNIPSSPFYQNEKVSYTIDNLIRRSKKSLEGQTAGEKAARKALINKSGRCFELTEVIMTLLKLTSIKNSKGTFCTKMTISNNHCICFLHNNQNLLTFEEDEPTFQNFDYFCKTFNDTTAIIIDPWIHYTCDIGNYAMLQKEAIKYQVDHFYIGQAIHQYTIELIDVPFLSNNLSAYNKKRIYKYNLTFNPVKEKLMEKYYKTPTQNISVYPKSYDDIYGKLPNQYKIDNLTLGYAKDFSKTIMELPESSEYYDNRYWKLPNQYKIDDLMSDYY